MVLSRGRQRQRVTYARLVSEGTVWLCQLECHHWAGYPRVRNVFEGPRPAPRRVVCAECRA